VRAVAGLAMAACMVIASAVGIRALHSKRGANGFANIEVAPKNGGEHIVALTKPIIVTIGAADADAPTGTAVAEISIGAGADTPAGDRPTFAEGIITHSSRSLIASGSSTAQDTAQMPY
jgi:hypothetical protein